MWSVLGQKFFPFRNFDANGIKGFYSKNFQYDA